MKKIILLFMLLFSSNSYSKQLNCEAIYKENTLGGAIKSFEISKIKKINDNHYDLKLKLAGSIRQKLDNFPTEKTHTLIDIKCANTEKEKQLKALFKL
ncbi:MULTISPECIES: hypothetical protein [unclassified Gilliamella]|uniref:hypothetical protein n=1 Tax=unclassified Gilliamella TaxID=2685620 RepID=UPI00080DECD9|nr:hypothetical protein [Gilliamella apicola]OCG35750.1 hypothetical protein A9G32_06690 [Gilliamella apicola]OCG50745.1 hypothetical protein A9G26_05960 [Gilliamella apicola]OCG54270.1 hypothetical protein A9G27_07245 [Gilliamella apicola]